jgi:DNA-binding GntR family transcriptional regulator
VRSFSSNETAELYELYKRLQCFAVEVAVPQMSDTDIRRLETILAEAVAALQRGDIKTYTARDREFNEIIAEQSGNSALIETLARFALQIQPCGGVANVSREFTERAAHGYDDIIQAFKSRDAPRAVFLMRAHISQTQQAILARFPNEMALL